MGKISQLPDDLLDVISSMLPGRESIEFWMVRNRFNDRSDKRVTTELRKRHNNECNSSYPSHDVDGDGYYTTTLGRISHFHMSVGDIYRQWVDDRAPVVDTCRFCGYVEHRNHWS